MKIEFLNANNKKENTGVECRFKSLFENREIKKMHETFELSFNNFFKNRNYVRHESAPLLSKEDKSTVFTGASINAVKYLLLSQEFPQESNGVFMNQECIRTQEIDKAFDNSYIPFGQAYFNMSSILSKPGRFKEVMKEALEFTQNEMGIDSSRLLINSTQAYKDLRGLDSYIKDIAIEYDSKNPEKYIWKYGMEGVHGEGLAICLYNKATESYWDVGNVVKILNQQGEELGTEFGYGQEFFLAAMLNVDDPSKLSKIFEKYEFNPGLNMKFYSYLETAVKIKEAGGKIKGRREGCIYRKYLKALQFLGRTLGLTEEDVIQKMIKYNHFSGGKVEDFKSEHEFINLHKKRKDDFKGIVKRVNEYLQAIKEGRPTKEKISDPKRMIDNYLAQNGINRKEVADVLEKLRKFGI